MIEFKNKLTLPVFKATSLAAKHCRKAGLKVTKRIVPDNPWK